MTFEEHVLGNNAFDSMCSPYIAAVKMVQCTMLQEKHGHQKLQNIWQHLFYCVKTHSNYVADVNSPITSLYTWSLVSYCSLRGVMTVFEILNPHSVCLCSPAWYRVSIQAGLPERREGERQEDPGESHRAQGPPHLLPLSAWPPHWPWNPAQWLHWEGSQG